LVTLGNIQLVAKLIDALVFLRTFKIEKKSSLREASLTRLEPHHHLVGVNRQRLFTERSAVAKVDPTIDRITAASHQSAVCFCATVQCRDLQILVAESRSLHVEFEVVQNDPD